ncbi:hypothetical protein ACA910_022169 [Epithemia clementina (nom. ined.)]
MLASALLLWPCQVSWVVCLQFGRTKPAYASLDHRAALLSWMQQGMARPRSSVTFISDKRRKKELHLAHKKTKLGALKQEEEEALSDVDTRVLREMLQESKLDLDTEEDVRKLLERGTKKTTNAAPNSADMNEESEFESKVLQKLSDTKLWKALSAKTSDILESAKLWVSNKVERDLKTLAALGVFAWDRVVRDVGRALPATATRMQDTKKTFLLSNSSSFEEVFKRQTTESLRKELNRPSDEIKSVSQDIWDILSGKTTKRVAGGDRRGLRTVAKAGTANIADRQRRAYQQTRKKREQETVVKGIQKIPGGIVDVTYELQRELKSETSPAGYKTKPIRKAIAAGVTGTGKYLKGITEAARLAAAERKAKRLAAAGETSTFAEAAAAAGDRTFESQTDAIPRQAASEMSSAKPEASDLLDAIQSEQTELLVQLQFERGAMLERLLACIQQPESTWLQSEFLTKEARSLSQESLREVATLIILLKDELAKTTLAEPSEASLESYLEQLRLDLRFVEEVRESVVSTISSLIGNTLFDIVVGKYDVPEDETPILLRLDEIEEMSLENSATAAVISSPEKSERRVWQDATVADVVTPVNKSSRIVDVITDVVVETQPGVYMSVENEAATGVADVSKVAALIPEIVSDDDFEGAVGVKKVKTASSGEWDEEEDEDEEAERPFILTVVLRSLDVAFFLLEKIFVVAIPRTVTFASTAAKRVSDINEGGKGKKGWEKIRNTVDPKGRY